MNLSFRLVELADEDIYFQWANDAEVRQRSFTTEAISLDTHKAWFRAKLKDENVFMLVFTVLGNIPVGQVRINEVGGEHVIAVSVDNKYRGKGYGAQMIKMAVNEYHKKRKKNTVVAFIKNDNTASVRIFEKAGFKLSDKNENDAFFKFTFTPVNNLK